jgi:hypothetical protein
VLIRNGMKRGGTDIGLFVTCSGLFVILAICLLNCQNMITALK